MSLLVNALVIADTLIRQDAQGRYGLNDLHRAAGGAKRNQPSDWLRQPQTQGLIAAIQAAESTPGIPGVNQNQPLSSVPGAPATGGGIDVCKELVYGYAMWISPAFHLQVIRAYDALVRDTSAGKTRLPEALSANTQFSPHTREFRAACTLARAVGLRGNQAVLAANRAYRQATGVDVLELLETTHLPADSRGQTYTPTELGQQRIPAQSARQMNHALQAAGLQTRDAQGRWVATEAGTLLCEWSDTGKRHSDGTPVKQLKWFAEVLERLQGTPQQAMPAEAQTH
ncbi:KilA-N domain-containing protein [Thiorhodococcus minor]|uniref:KilA-N domain-containing protein n=1 Tax=Thiorhodococcus minor TaxID=57489 RepID=A0A6M0JS16_9GAMM|nr:KilA-N domain-containing protein [Thiorhodococcus minor]NEV60328.1 KilA-N domain-containing protein [Thiorhodococcus minor]